MHYSKYMEARRKMSATTFILLALVPYTKQNLLLSFSPNRFFNELDKRTTPYSRKILREAYLRVQKSKLINITSNRLEFTAAGNRKVQPYIAKTLAKNVYVLVIFDIPERNTAARRRFRILLKELEFIQVQKSVWASRYDYVSMIEEMLDELKIHQYVQVFEAAHILPKPS